MSLLRTPGALAALLAAAALLLGAAPPVVPTTDVHGDPLPKGALARLGTTRLRHGDPVTGVAFSGDGKTLASVATDHAVRLWDAGTGKQLGALGEQLAYANVYQATRWLSCVAVSPDGKTVASGTRYGLVTIWESATGKELHRLTPAEGVVSLDFAPDGRSLASVGRDSVRVYDPATGKELYRLTGPAELMTLVRFSPDGKKVGTGGVQGTVRLWDVNTKKELHQFNGLAGAVNALAFSGDGKHLASGSGESKLLVWDVASAKMEGRFDGHRGGVVGLGLSKDGKVLTSAGARDGEIRLCDVAGKDKTRVLVGPPDVLNAAALSPDGKTLALGGVQGSVFLWDLTKGSEREPDGHRGRVHFLAFSGDGRRVVSAGGEGSFWVWDSASGRPLRRHLLAKDTSRTSLGAASGTGVTFAFSAGGRFAATRKKDGGIGTYEADTGKELRQLRDKGGVVTCGAMTADGQTLAVAGADGVVQIWDVARGRELRKITADKEGVAAVAISPDGSTLASIGAGRTIRLWAVSSGTELWHADLPAEVAWKVAFSPDGRCLAAGGSAGIVLVWEMASGKQVRAWSGHNGYVGSLCFSPDGRSLAVGSWISVRLWDLGSGKPRGELRCHRGDVTSLAFSADSKVIATGGTDSSALLWQVSRAFSAAPEPSALADKDLQARWDDLAGDAEKAYQATHDLAAAPAQAAQLLGKHLRPAPKADAKRLKKLIDDLGADDADVSKAAAEELEKLGEAAVPALREALKKAEDVDVRLRLSVLINDATSALPPPARLRTLRAIHVLELAGTKEAIALLKTLASGAAESRLTAEAKAALARLAKR